MHKSIFLALRNKYKLLLQNGQQKWFVSIYLFIRADEAEIFNISPSGVLSVRSILT